jgi:hypothetical protein
MLKWERLHALHKIHMMELILLLFQVYIWYSYFNYISRFYYGIGLLLRCVNGVYGSAFIL